MKEKTSLTNGTANETFTTGFYPVATLVQPKHGLPQELVGQTVYGVFVVYCVLNDLITQQYFCNLGAWHRSGSVRQLQSGEITWAKMA